MTPTADIKAINYDIGELAMRFAIPAAEAHDILWSEIHALEQAARVQEYVPILALKQVKEHLRERPSLELISGLA